jgi:excisionase family DNA binding protein
LRQELLTIEEAADYLKLTPYTVRRYLREGKLPGLRVGGQWRIGREDLAKKLLTGAVGAESLVQPDGQELMDPADSDRAGTNMTTSAAESRHQWEQVRLQRSPSELEADHGDFFDHKSLAQLIAEQGTQPLQRIESLRGDFWPEEESAGEFLAQLHTWRDEQSDQSAGQI